MKILVGSYILESNAFIPKKTTLKDFRLETKQDCLSCFPISEYLKEKGIEVRPLVYADAGNQGVLEKEEFLKLEQLWLTALEEEKGYDGLLLHLHGASETEELGSGEVHLLRKIREKVGRDVPIAVVCDPHGNLCQSYTDDMDILLSYRESPHTDRLETMEKAADLLSDLIEDKRKTNVVYRHLDMLLGGEMSVSKDEPVASINRLLDEYEKDERILRCNWHVGYIRHDSDIAGCSITVVPRSLNDEGYAQEVADELSDYVWKKRKEFHFTGVTAEVEEALTMVEERKEKPCFITDSGDNVTAGALGVNTVLLKKILKKEDDRRYLFSSINDEEAYKLLASHKEGDIVKILLGRNIDELSAPIDLDVQILGFGKQMPSDIFGDSGAFGSHVLVRVKDRPICIVVADTSQPYIEEKQIGDLQIKWEDYDIIVVKCGYAFPEMLEHFCVMALSDGATLQDVRRLPFQKVERPIFPLDDM